MFKHLDFFDLAKSDFDVDIGSHSQCSGNVLTSQALEEDHQDKTRTGWDHEYTMCTTNDCADNDKVTVDSSFWQYSNKETNNHDVIREHSYPLSFRQDFGGITENAKMDNQTNNSDLATNDISASNERDQPSCVLPTTQESVIRQKDSSLLPKSKRKRGRPPKTVTSESDCKLTCEESRSDPAKGNEKDGMSYPVRRRSQRNSYKTSDPVKQNDLTVEKCKKRRKKSQCEQQSSPRNDKTSAGSCNEKDPKETKTKDKCIIFEVELENFNKNESRGTNMCDDVTEQGSRKLSIMFRSTSSGDGQNIGGEIQPPAGTQEKAAGEQDLALPHSSSKDDEQSKNKSEGENFGMEKKSKHKAVKCPECNKMLCHRGALKIHMLTHSGDQPYQCNYCERRFSVKVNYKRHLLIHEGSRTYVCEICGRDFYLKFQLDKHMQKHEEKKPIMSRPRRGRQTCEICGKSIRSYSELQIHLRAHTGEKAFHCDICKRGFNVGCNYRRHMLRHGDNKMYKCSLCDKAYYEKRHLNIHFKRTHHDVKTEKDPTPDDSSGVVRSSRCQETFPADTACTEHKASTECTVPAKNAITPTIHKDTVHSDENKLTCSTCDKTFKNRKSLNSHMLCHAKEGKYTCNYCDARFKQHQGLWRHLQYHSGTKSHVCKTCDARFAVKGDLVRHEKTHAGKIFRCQYCSTDFERRDSAVAHVARCHTMWLCVNCNMPFQSKHLLLKHSCPASSASITQPIYRVTSDTDTFNSQLIAQVESQTVEDATSTEGPVQYYILPDQYVNQTIAQITEDPAHIHLE